MSNFNKESVLKATSWVGVSFVKIKEIVKYFMICATMSLTITYLLLVNHTFIIGVD